MTTCPSINPSTGTKCGLPEGHIGQHANGTICIPWENKESEANLAKMYPGAFKKGKA